VQEKVDDENEHSISNSNKNLEVVNDSTNGSFGIDATTFQQAQKNPVSIKFMNLFSTVLRID